MALVVALWSAKQDCINNHRYWRQCIHRLISCNGGTGHFHLLRFPLKYHFIMSPFNFKVSLQKFNLSVYYYQR